MLLATLMLIDVVLGVEKALRLLNGSVYLDPSFSGSNPDAFAVESIAGQPRAYCVDGFGGRSKGLGDLFG